jgi:hypothetical protein
MPAGKRSHLRKLEVVTVVRMTKFDFQGFDAA